MAMTVAEANAVNDVLTYLLNLNSPDDFLEAARRAGAAAELLAGSASRKLGTGITARDVRAGWGFMR